MNGFIDYVLSFYGIGGVYEMGATREQVEQALNKHLANCLSTGLEFCGDTVDREWVRDIMIEDYGLVHPSSAVVA